MMSSCWKENPDERPTFDQIAEFFSSLLSNSEDNFQYSYVRDLTQNIPETYLSDEAGDDYVLGAYVSSEIDSEVTKYNEKVNYVFGATIENETTSTNSTITLPEEPKHITSNKERDDYVFDAYMEDKLANADILSAKIVHCEENGYVTEAYVDDEETFTNFGFTAEEL